MSFEINDIIKIVDIYSTYDLYSEWATRYNLKNWKHGLLPIKGDICVVVDKAPWGVYEDTEIFAVKRIVDDVTFIMSHDGMVGHDGMEYPNIIREQVKNITDDVFNFDF